MCAFKIQVFVIPEWVGHSPLPPHIKKSRAFIYVPLKSKCLLFQSEWVTHLSLLILKKAEPLYMCL